MNSLFLDSSFVIALELANDQDHKRAIRQWRAVHRTRLVTTSAILAEVVTFLNARNRHERAVAVGTMLLTSPSVEFLHIDQPLLQAGWDYFCRHSDKRYSLADSISFVVMADRGITQALSFDRHFEQAGFERLPREE